MKPILIIPHYIITDGLRELATNTIKSMRATADVYIISVDDGSPLDASFLKELSDEVITMPQNSGFAKAVNAGLRAAMGKPGAHYIGQANNDIEVYDGWLEALVEPFGKWDDVGITGIVHTKDKAEAKRRNGNERTITSGGMINDRMQSGSLWLSTKEVLATVGLFDEQFEGGGEEDVDLFMRMRDQHGLQLIMSNKSVFWTPEGATRWNEELDGNKQHFKAIEEKNYGRYAKKWGYDIRERGIPFYEEVLEN